MSCSHNEKSWKGSVKITWAKITTQNPHTEATAMAVNEFVVPRRSGRRQTEMQTVVG